MSEHRRTIAVDFDGVLHAYSKGWQGGACYDIPVDGALGAMEELAQTYRLVVYTARADLDPVCAWLAEWGFYAFIDSVTKEKPMASFYIDDRAIRFMDWSDTLSTLTTLVAMEVKATIDEINGMPGEDMALPIAVAKSLGRFAKTSTVKAAILKRPAKIKTPNAIQEANAGDILLVADDGQAWAVSSEYLYANYREVVEKESDETDEQFSSRKAHHEAAMREQARDTEASEPALMKAAKVWA